MNAVTSTENAAIASRAGLELLREPVPEHLISPLPKGTKAQNECPNDEKINCKVCGGWHHPKVRHLDYVGHAAATHRLLDADLNWSWEPLAFNEKGLPCFDESGGLWIKLTVCGVTRLGYGHADKKAHMDAGSREKEVIGDAIRNAAMRFGLALDLWSKADLHKDDEDEQGERQAQVHAQNAAAETGQHEKKTYPQELFDENYIQWRGVIDAKRKTPDELIAFVESKGLPLTEAQKTKIRGH